MVALLVHVCPPRARRRSPMLALALALVAATGPAAADAQPPLHAVAAKFPPYTNEESGHAAGPTAELLSLLAERLERRLDLRLLPLARALATAENEPDILIAMIARSPARETQFRWVCPVLDYDVKLFRRRVRDDIAVRSIDDLKRWQVVGANGDVKTNYLRRQGIPVVTTADEDEAIRLLLYDRVDLMPGHPASMHLRLKALGLPLDTLVPIMDLPALSNRLYLAYGPQTPAATVDAAAAACAALIKDGAVSRLMIPAMLN